VTAGARIALLLLIAAVASACTLDFVRGSGELTTVTADVEEFSAISASSAYEVDVSLANATSVTLEVDDNVVDDLVVEVRGDTLHLEVRAGLSLTNVTLRAEVTTPSLDELVASGAARIEVAETIEADELTLDVSGASELNAPIAVRTLEAEASGASTLGLRGDADTATFDVSGASSLEARSLAVGTADVEVSGASNAEVEVTRLLDADVSGSSTLRYRGDPDQVNESVSGASRIQRS
jgi:hypothetical protein